MAESPTGQGKVFISYSHRDKEYLDRLQEHLKPHVRAGTIPLWVDTNLKPGDDWKEEIERSLASAQVAILLVSVSFLASDFVAEEELPKLLAAAEGRGARIFPVILTPCGFRRTKLSRFQAVNDPARPFSGVTQHEQDVIWEQVVDEVLEALEEAGPLDLKPAFPEAMSAELQTDHTPLRKSLLTYQGHTAWVWDIAWSPDGRCLASASNDKTVRLWEADSGVDIRSYAGHSSYV